MAWDFSTEPEFQKKLDWVEDLCKEKIEPLDLVFPYAIRSPHPKVKALVKEIQDEIKDQGLWAIFLDEELGGPGYGQLKLGLLNEILGRYGSAPQMFGAAAPDTGNMEMLAAYGTEEQKKRWLEPMLRQEMWSAYSMTEPQGGSDPNLFKTHAVKEIQDEIKDQGLWAIFLDEELGGPGYGQLKLGLLNEILGRYGSAPQMFGAAAPDTGNMEMLAAYGTEEQKKRWLEPMLRQEMWSAYSMTEPQGGSDPNLFKTHAVKDGEEWVINGEKWFTSAGRVADILFVMCTNGMFVVPRTTPGVEIQPEPRNHNHVIYNDVRVPLDHLLGPEDGAKILAQRRLGGGRIHHAMRTIAQCKLAFDMMCERALSRESHGKIIADHQMVQEKIADSYAQIRMLRLFVLETAWKIDNTSTQETRTDIAAVKYTMAKVLRDVSFNALHILGSIGTTNLTPLQAMYAGAPTMGIADGVDEVHKATVARNVLKGYRPQEHPYWPTEYYPAKREKARAKFEPLFEKDPEYREIADGYAKYFAARG